MKSSFVVVKYDGLSYVWAFDGAYAIVVAEASDQQAGTKSEVVDVNLAKRYETRV